MKSEGFRCPGSGHGKGFPHGKDKHVERAKRAAERASKKAAKK